MTGERPWWETTDFDFIRIPKELFRNPYYGSLSPESKQLYGFLLDRASLSWANGQKWRTPEGDPFVIFTLAEIQERLHCGEDKATKLLRMLEQHHLISRTRPKRDGPYHIVVRPFRQEPGKSGFTNPENTGSPTRKNGVPEPGKTGVNNTENNNTEKNKTDKITQLEWDIKEHIQYDFLMRDGYPKAQVDAVVEVMLQALTSPAKTITVSGIPMDAEIVRGYLMKAEVMRIQYLFDHMDEQATPIHSHRAYYLARLCDPDGVVDAFYETLQQK